MVIMYIRWGVGVQLESVMEVIDAKIMMFEAAMFVTIVSSDMLDDFSLIVKMWIFLGVCWTGGRVISFVESWIGNDKIAKMVGIIVIVMAFKAAFVMWAGIFAENDRFKAEFWMWIALLTHVRAIAMQGA